MPLRRILLPWARAEEAVLTTERKIPEIKGGNWLRGRALFGGKATCAKCHTLRGEGAHVGPDLGNLPQRDYASVVRDIREPGAGGAVSSAGAAVVVGAGTDETAGSTAGSTAVAGAGSTRAASS